MSKIHFHRLAFVLLSFILLPLFIFSGIIPFSQRFNLLHVMLIVLAIYTGISGFTPDDLGFTQRYMKESILINGLISLLLIFLLALAMLADLYHPGAVKLNGFFFYYVFFLGPVQEFLYRSFLRVELKKDGIENHWHRIIISSILFSFLHIIYRSVPFMLATFVAGLLWSYTYEKYPYIYGPMLSHAVVGIITVSGSLA